MKGKPQTLESWTQAEIDFLLIEPIGDMVEILKQLMTADNLNDILKKANLSHKQFMVSAGKLIVLSNINAGKH